MAKVYTGTYGKDTTDETALVTNLLKYPEIGKKLIQQYPRFSLTYLLEAAGRNAAEKIIGDYSFEWKMMGRYRKPAKLDATFTGAAAGTTFTCTFDHDTSNGIHGDNLNVNDIVRFADGSTAMVTAEGTPTATQNVVTFRAIDATTSAGTNSAIGDIVGVIGNAFNQGSLASEVGQNYAYPDTYKNWLTLSRKKTKIMGTDLTDVTWIESNGHRLWYFTKEQQMTDQFMYELECQRWYGKKSVGTAANAADYPGDSGIGAPSAFTAGLPIMGDGLLAQIDSSNQATYTAGALTEEDIVNFIGTLSKNALSAEGNVWTVFTGTQGRIDFHRAMKDLLVTLGSGTPVFAGKGGGDVALGANFTEYNILGNKMILAYCPVFDDPNLHNSISSTFDTSNESGKMVFVDMGMQNGVSNVELIAKGAEGFNRSFVKKYVPGMVNPYDYNSMMAANGDDFFECQILSESGIILRNPLSCGILSNS